jgi:hypothetical protein
MPRTVIDAFLTGRTAPVAINRTKARIVQTFLSGPLPLLVLFAHLISVIQRDAFDNPG